MSLIIRFALVSCLLIPAIQCADAQSTAPAEAPDNPTPNSPRASAEGQPATAQSPGGDQPVSSERAGQEGTSEPFPIVDGQSLSQLQQQLSALEEAGLSDGDRAAAAENYRKAIEWETAVGQHLDQARDFENRRTRLSPSESPATPGEGAAEKSPAAQLRREMGDLAYYKARLAEQLPTRENVAELPLDELEAKAAAADKQLAEYRAAQDKWLAEPARRQTRLAQITDELATANADVAKITELLSQQQSNGVGDAARLSLRARYQARLRAGEAKLHALQREQAYLRESTPLVKIRLDDAARRLPEQEKWVTDLSAEINRRRQQEASQQALQAQRDAKIARPKAIAELADQNAELAQDRKDIAQRLEKITAELTQVADQKSKLEEEFKLTQQKLGVGELSHALGELLRNQQDKLPDLRVIKRRRALRSAELSDIQRDLYEMSSRSTQLASIDEEMAETLAQVERPDQQARQEIERLLKAERDLLDDMIEDYNSYATDLDELDAVESQIQTITEDYGNFIAERVLWIRSADLLHVRDVGPAVDAAVWSLDPRHWAAAGESVVSGCRRRPFEASTFILSLAAMLYFQRPARRRLRALGEEARKRTCGDIWPTFHAVWLTAFVALPWPVLIAQAARAMDNPLNESEFIRSLSLSLRTTAVCILLIELVRQMCRREGLADAHFGWPEACLTQVRRRVRWLIILATPLILWTAGLEVQRVEPMWNATLGRICFIALMLVCTWVLYGLLVKKSSPLRKFMVSQSSGWVASFLKVGRPTAAYLPAALAVLAASGYYYTAQDASLRFLQTTGLMLGVLVLGGLTRRWLLVNHRQLARAQATQRRAQLMAAAESEGSAAPIEVVEETVDLAALSEQTEQLVRTVLAAIAAVGLYLVWSDIVPALAFIDSPIPGLGGDEFPLTWGRLLLVMLILGVTYLAVRDIPALLEVVLLQKLPLDAGVRYALGMVCRYVLTGIGLTAAYQSLGFTGNIQWLIAAMGVGLGFGLQEIFANFVSGIILLFERPIRVGDIVTLGEKTGIVSRIRMRATTIVDWDRKEYIVPNKDLMTERLLNWTLTDLTNRIVIEVGVAYGSDTDRAIELMLEAAAEHPLILADPPTIATFEGFGDSALNLVLRCYLPNLEKRLLTIHDLHGAIDRKFRQAGIEIPFPQRDLHLRTVPPGARAFHENGKHAGGSEANGNGANGHFAPASSDQDQSRSEG